MQAPANMKKGIGSKEKNGTSPLINKSTSGKSKNVNMLKAKHHYVNISYEKSSSSSIGDIKSTNFAKNKNPESSREKNTSNIGIKTNNVYSGKSATTMFGETGGSSKSNKISDGGLQPTIDKKYVSQPTNVMSNSKNKQTSMTFGIIWLPTRKRNKVKNGVYNPYNNDKSEHVKERAPSRYIFTVEDSSNHQVFTKKEEESLLPEKIKMPVDVAAMNSDSLPVEIAYVGNSDEQKEFIKYNNDDMKEAAGDSYDKNDNDEYLENKGSLNKIPDTTLGKQEDGDKVDSVYLRPPPAHKTQRSEASTTGEEDCDVTCLYYTLQCCDCVIS